MQQSILQALRQTFYLCTTSLHRLHLLALERPQRPLTKHHCDGICFGRHVGRLTILRSGR
jgi:hypothetical protein